MITLIVGCLIFGSLAWLWRNNWSEKRIHGFLAFLYGIAAWFCSFWVGVWIQLDLIQAGTLGNVVGSLTTFSMGVGIVCFFILRKKDEENKEVEESLDDKELNSNT